MAERRRPRQADRRPAQQLVVDGPPEEAPDYVDALLDLLEQHGESLHRWWRSTTRDRLELRWEVWGSGRHMHLRRSSGALHCVVQRAPESTWTSDGPAAHAFDDLTAALDVVAGHLRRPPPTLADGSAAVRPALDKECRTHQSL